MLFNSYEFIFAYLPVVVVGFYLLDRLDRTASILWLGGASLFFYGWWDWHYLPLLLASVLFNFGAGVALMRLPPDKARRLRHLIVVFAVAANLAALCYFKYTNFLVDNVNLLLADPLHIERIVLPIGISFFTFTQIAYLIDTYQLHAREPRFANYLLFVTYFPHLIAGPIIHHREMMPQFARRSLGSVTENLSVGLSIFVIGLFKKVVIADGVALFATPLFDAVRGGAAPSLIEAWCAALAYLFQLYFDFSGYSDMAVGLSRMFGIRLPVNFNSPLKARSIIDFWQRWHMTLTRYLRLYLYTPITAKIMSWRMEHGYGLSRRDMRTAGGFASMVAVPLFYTMGLAGIWHGAGLQFAVFGLLHAAYLTMNHAWRVFGPQRSPSGRIGKSLVLVRDVALTWLAVLVADVFFRASSVSDALMILRGMVGLNGVVLPQGYGAWLGSLGLGLARLGVQFAPSMAFYGGVSQIACFALLFLIVWTMPNTQEIMRRYRPALDVSSVGRPFGFLLWRPHAAAIAVIALLAVGSVLSLSKPSSFLYFQF